LPRQSGNLAKSGLKPVKEALPEEITYEEIRLVAAHLSAQPEIQDAQPKDASPGAALPSNAEEADAKSWSQGQSYECAEPVRSIFEFNQVGA